MSTLILRLTGVSSPAAFEGRSGFLKRVSPRRRFSCSGCEPKRPQTPWNRITIPDDPLPMGRRDCAVQPGGRAADACGVDRRRPAGIRRPCHAGDPGADTAAWLAGLPLDARTRPVPVARPDLGVVPDRPAGGRDAAVLCHYRRHAGAALLGSGARCRGPLRPRGQRPTFLLCQCFVTLSAVVPCRDRPRSVPLVTGLCRSSGNAGKIAMAKGLLRAVSALGPVCLLLDAWSMRGSLIRTALRLGHEVIGQVRRDTALFALPPPRQPGRRGRSRLYGARLDADAVAALPASVHAIAGYAGRSARLRHAVCRPRFLKGVIVRVVWCELAKSSGGWAKARLLLSTDPTLSAPAIVEAYSRRWSIEPLFRDLKIVDGLG